MVTPIPKGYHAITPYLVVQDPAALIAFTKKAFGAKVRGVLKGPGGAIMHAEVTIGDSVVMMGGGRPDGSTSPGVLYLYVRDTDAVYRKALKAGGRTIQAPEEKFYGDRNAAVADTNGNQWWIATRVRDLTMAQLKKAAP